VSTEASKVTELLRHGAADRLVDELDARSRLQRLDVEHDVAELLTPIRQ
jgi:hypothetical protein